MKVITRNRLSLTSSTALGMAEGDYSPTGKMFIVDHRINNEYRQRVPARDVLKEDATKEDYRKLKLLLDRQRDERMELERTHTEEFQTLLLTGVYPCKV